MRSGRTILEVLFPKVRAEILRLLFSVPAKERYVRELMQLSDLTLHTVQDELRKLAAAGLVTSWSNNYHRFYRANRQHPLFSAVTRIVNESGRLPTTKHSALNRPLATPARRRRGVKTFKLPPNRPPEWGIVSNRRTHSTA